MKRGTRAAALFGGVLIVTAGSARAQEPTATPSAAGARTGATAAVVGSASASLRPNFCPPCNPMPPARECHIQVEARVGDLWQPVITLDPRRSTGQLTPRETTLFRMGAAMCSAPMRPLYFQLPAGENCSVAWPTMPPIPPPCPPFQVVPADLRLSRLTRLTVPSLGDVRRINVTRERWNGRDWEGGRPEDAAVTPAPGGESVVSLRETAVGLYRVSWTDPSGERQQVTYETGRRRP